MPTLRIKDIAEQHGLTHANAFARHVRISLTTAAHIWKDPTYVPSLTILLAIAQAFDITLDALIADESPSAPRAYRHGAGTVMVIKHQLHTLMAARGMSVQELSRRSGISQPRLSEIRHHPYSNLRSDTIARLCRALECSLGEFGEVVEIPEYLPR